LALGGSAGSNRTHAARDRDTTLSPFVFEAGVGAERVRNVPAAFSERGVAGVFLR
jgi:hypothetical protein